MTTTASQRTALYRLYDTDGQLLYIGITNDTSRRFGYHRRTKPWWPQVAHKEVRWFDALTEASQAERDAIAAEKPIHNISANALKITKTKRNGPRTGYRDIAGDLRRAILDGYFAPGARLPGLNQLMRDYGVAEATVRQALSVLKSEQLITSRQGAGVFARDLDGNQTVTIAVDKPEDAAERLFRYMSPGNLATLARALTQLIEAEPDA